MFGKPLRVSQRVALKLEPLRYTVNGGRAPGRPAGVAVVEGSMMGDSFWRR
jgi:hypothetical protein